MEIKMKCIHCHENEPNKESGLCDSCESKESTKINGLLYLPALGLCVSAILTPISFIKYFSMLSSNLPSYVVYYLYAGTFILFIDILMTYFSAWTFFKKKKSIKKVIISYYIFGTITALYFTILASYLFNMPLTTPDIRALTSAFVGLIFWVPYFLLSKRIPMVFSK
ncbi:DUF2569 domain-containing protein [Budviciaceae bacterium CWB-B4]|uniref:DUF2569 domain-containing protein n=1 Tax=Limnobaculum xujianqingii TaxID=2738837 RepID=A0A9D7AK73_9GAMM|nr:DUF2569 domain-containing protein [Limnobaculum xujianqingii]MBK5074142.1 DUF2569 domain-containing protein [Limnobaculum xujianqingii]MBK5177451.1 DUF2569 domain-containing protein [Limnobaculum xujianqingii]